MNNRRFGNLSLLTAYVRDLHWPNAETLILPNVVNCTRIVTKYELIIANFAPTAVIFRVMWSTDVETCANIDRTADKTQARKSCVRIVKRFVQTLEK